MSREIPHESENEALKGFGCTSSVGHFAVTIHLGIIGRDASVSKSNRLHVDICQFFFIDLRHILLSFLNDR